MEFDVKYPIMLTLFIPACLLLFLYFKYERNRGSLEHYSIGILRFLVFTSLIVALTVPQILLPIKEEKIIFLVDRSASVQGTNDEALSWLEKSISSKREGQSHAVVSFGRDVAVETSFTKGRDLSESFNGEIQKDETNIEEAIQFAETLIPNEENGRLVLLTDGNETAGRSREAVKLLRNRQIELDTVELKRQGSEDSAITDFKVPPSLYEGERADLSVTVASNVRKKAGIRISLNNQEILKENVLIKEGENVFTFSYKVENTGMFVFKAEILADKDTYVENNALQAVSNVKGTPKVLIVEGKESGQLAEILSSSGLFVESLIPEKLPVSLSGYLEYQSIIFNNVSATSISQKQMELMETAVKEFGTGFIMTGGEESFGLGGYFKTPIEKLLPVDMDIKGKKQMPSLGLVIVMDRSGSMSGNKITLAKEAAARSVELLREEDTLGFIAFDDRPWVISETKPLKDKEKVIKKIRSITPGGGTEIFSSLEKAYDELSGLKLQRKHIILLTDGQSATGGDYEELIETGKEKNITLSTVALGSDADRALLEELAIFGTGRFYNVTDATVIPSILSRETVMATRTYIEDQPFFPILQPYPDWKELLGEGVPKMNAYIATTAKQSAQVPLISEKKDPVLAEWQYGLGKTFAFTSDTTGKWSGDWAGWEIWPQFLTKMTVKSLPQYESDPYSVSVEKKEDNTVVKLESGMDKFSPVEAAVVSQAGKVVDTNTKLVAPGKYEVIFPNEPGMFFLRVKQPLQNGETKVYQTGFTVPYSDEYLLKGTNRAFIKDLSSLADGRVLAKPEEAFRPLKHKANSKQPISEWLLLAAFFLFVLEIIVRRFGLQALVHYLPKIPKSVPSTGDSEKVAGVKKLAAAKGRQEVKRELPKLESESNDVLQQNLQKEKRTKSLTPKNIQAQLKPDIQTSSSTEDRMKRLLEARKRKK